MPTEKVQAEIKATFLSDETVVTFRLTRKDDEQSEQEISFRLVASEVAVNTASVAAMSILVGCEEVVRQVLGKYGAQPNKYGH